jgi:DNA-binding HxlR family transcriptional regulator
MWHGDYPVRATARPIDCEVLIIISRSTEIFAGGGEAMPAVNREVSECPVDATMRVIAGRWKGTILWRLQDGPKRTGELKRSIPGITERMLILRLQELVADGIVEREDKKTFPPCVYYSLSSYGRTISPLIDLISRWGCAHLERLSPK